MLFAAAVGAAAVAAAGELRLLAAGLSASATAVLAAGLWRGRSIVVPWVLLALGAAAAASFADGGDPARSPSSRPGCSRGELSYWSLETRLSRPASGGVAARRAALLSGLVAGSIAIGAVLVSVARIDAGGGLALEGREWRRPWPSRRRCSRSAAALPEHRELALAAAALLRKNSPVETSPDKSMRLTPTEYAVLGLLTFGELRLRPAEARRPQRRLFLDAGEEPDLRNASPSRGRGPRHASRDPPVRQARQAALPADGGRRGLCGSGSPRARTSPT